MHAPGALPASHCAGRWFRYEKPVQGFGLRVLDLGFEA